MGMFDTVNVRCRKCGETIEFQSKSGKCNLNVYEETSVPVSVAVGIEGDVEWCSNCKTKHKYGREEDCIDISKDIKFSR